MRGDSLRGKIQIESWRGKDKISSNIAISIKRVLIKNYHEARGYVDVNLRISFRSKGELSKKILKEVEPQKWVEKISFNTDFYLMSVYSYEFRDLIKHFNEFLLKRDEKATVLIPPLALDFYDVFDERLNQSIEEIKKINQAFQPDKIEIHHTIKFEKEIDKPYDPVGRVLRMISLEYSNKAHLNEIKRILRRIGGVEEKDLLILEKKWREGVIKLIEMALDYLETAPLDDESYTNTLINGLIEGSEEKSLNEIFGSITRLLAKDEGAHHDLIMRLNSLAMKLGVAETGAEIKKRTKILSKLVKFLKKGDYEGAAKLISDGEMKEILKDFEKQVKFDNETLIAILLFIYLIVKRDRKALVKSARKLMYKKETILGVIVDSFNALEEGNTNLLRKAYKKLSEQIAFFTYSKDLIRFPYNIIVTSMYITLADIAKAIGIKEAEKRSRNVASRMLEKMGISEVLKN